MGKSHYKGILEFFKSLHPVAPQGKALNRLQQLAAQVNGCILSKSCALTDFSRACEKQNTNKKNSLLQNTKRWLKNKWVDYETFFIPVADFFLQKLARRGELIFIIDGSLIGPCNTALMLSVLWQGKSIPIAWVVRQGEKGHLPEQMHLDLIHCLLAVCPANCRIVLLGDGEFDGQRLRQLCLGRSWEFVVRTSNTQKINCAGEWAPIRTLQAGPGDEYVFVENALDGIHAIWWHKPKYEAPIFLLTNMEPAGMACAYYEKRFEIECMFKQMKSRGFRLDKTQIRDPQRISNLLIVAAIAYIKIAFLGAFLKAFKKPEELEHVVCKDKLPRMAYLTLAWKCLKEDFDLTCDFFSNMSKNYSWFFP
jgi:hypothetical protein